MTKHELKKRYKGPEYDWLFNLIDKGSYWLINRDRELSELYRICDNDSQRDLLRDLLWSFHFFDDDIASLAYNEMLIYIENLNLKPEETVVMALSDSNRADSSHHIANELKIVLDLDTKSYDVMSDSTVVTIKAQYAKGKRNFILVDDFTGSGSTIKKRYKKFMALDLKDVSLRFCIMSGMVDAIESIRKEGIEIFVAYEMKKGISDFYVKEEVPNKIKDMLGLEGKLNKRIKDTKLSKYTLGYKKSEALYMRKGTNIPNNVFPIFWWKEYLNGEHRVTLFKRSQFGYSY